MRAAIVVIALLVAAWLVWWSRGDATPPIRPASPEAPAAASEAAVSVTTTEPESVPVEREMVDPRPAAPAPASASSPKQVVRGRVLFANGQPVGDASVRIGRERAQTGPDGTFALEVRDRDDDLAAWFDGYEPVTVADVAQTPDVVAGRVLDVTLPGKALTIDGWLVDAHGTPCKGWHVHLHGGATPIDDTGLPVLSAEDLAAGARVEDDGLSQSPRTRNPNLRELGDDGAFVFDGLRRGRDYVLRAWNEETLQTALSPPVSAGTRGYTFVVPPGSFREQVTGRAIDRHGGGIAGVLVRLTMRVHKSSRSESYETGQRVETDQEGRFRFERVIREDLLLRFDAAHVMSTHHELRANDTGDEVLVQLPLLCTFRVDPQADTPVPTSFRVLDAQQQPLRLTRQFGKGQSESSQRLRWTANDAWPDVTVSDEAAWLVLEVEERESRRVPLRLRRGDTVVVRG